MAAEVAVNQSPKYSPIQAALYKHNQQRHLAQIQNAQQAALAQALCTATPTWVTTVPAGTVYVQGTVITSSATTATTTGTLGNNVMNALYSSQPAVLAANSALVRDTLALMGEITIADGEPCKITLPDGSILDVAADGSFTINDKDAKVTYRANRVREFNPFINASDMIEAFIAFCKIVGIRQGEFLDIPIKHFITWLIIEAARADGEPKPELPLVPDLRRIARPRCRCGRFLSRRLTARKIAFCRPVCLERELAA